MAEEKQTFTTFALPARLYSSAVSNKTPKTKSNFYVWSLLGKYQSMPILMAGANYKNQTKKSCFFTVRPKRSICDYSGAI
jgi:hypothetical protein